MIHILKTLLIVSDLIPPRSQPKSVYPSLAFLLCYLSTRVNIGVSIKCEADETQPYPLNLLRCIIDQKVIRFTPTNV